ncbi:hypothetical protein CHARACLAT_031582 [Characodon lateralis]|uniref:Uncharacterized protein n=1 Tax=Characodon lateralis TaxID=208331 RepID=A0ABU7DZ92_9TELE|nr:hypothetical protein [Characodon lateralis]
MQPNKKTITETFVRHPQPAQLQWALAEKEPWGNHYPTVFGNPSPKKTPFFCLRGFFPGKWTNVEKLTIKNFTLEERSAPDPCPFPSSQSDGSE